MARVVVGVVVRNVFEVVVDVRVAVIFGVTVVDMAAVRVRITVGV
jgi:hypothetical protein